MAPILSLAARRVVVVLVAAVAFADFASLLLSLPLLCDRIRTFLEFIWPKGKRRKNTISIYLIKLFKYLMY